MKTVFIAATLILCACTAWGMVGGPIFPVGSQMTAMTVEASKVTLKTVSPSGSGSQEGTSDRMFLSARYGVLSNVDLSAMLGTSNLGFNNLYGGYSDFRSNWSFAWGAGARAGFPLGSPRYQAICGLQYTGFQPKGSSSNGIQTVSSKYIWHEVAPSVAVGARVGPLVPYLGVAKPFFFGRRDVMVAMHGRAFPAAGGQTSYADGQQPVRGILGLEWKLPDGYSLTAEGMTTPAGIWTLSLGVAQVLK
ncbi:MAG TPA: hypothetical protein VGL38_12560 [bacterium]|jgi:hypothetical protein